MTVSLLEILAAARAHAAPLAAESAGYLLLAVADHVVAAPRVVNADEVELMPDGGVRLRPARAGVADAGVEQVLRQLLARTLEVASSVGPALRRAAQRTEDTGLSALVRELETALIPVNRSAARRALSRLHRETERAKSAGKLARLLDAEPAQVLVAPLVAAPPEAIESAADFPEASPEAWPVQEAAPLPLVEAAPPRAPAPPPPVELTLTPEPRLAVGEPALTKPEPVVQRAKERGTRTPRLGTLVTLQTLPGEESERTERAPDVALEGEPELDLSIDVELEPDVVEQTVPLSASEAQPLVDPQPSRLPDVLSAMRELYTGVDADEAPTPIRDVLTELRVTLTPAPTAATPLTPTPAPTAAAPLTPAPSLSSTEFLTPGPAPALVLTSEAILMPQLEQVEDAWLTNSSLSGVVSAPVIFQSELAAPEVHDALTWDPGPVRPALIAAPLPPALVMAEPLPEPSPYAPAVLPARTSEVSELLESFSISDATEERELRSALKGMAGLELTPMPHPRVEEG